MMKGRFVRIAGVRAEVFRIDPKAPTSTPVIEVMLDANGSRLTEQGWEKLRNEIDRAIGDVREGRV